MLFDDSSWDRLLPLTFSKPVAEIRFGIFTIREKWENILKSECSFLTRPYLSKKYKASFKKENILINSSVIPNTDLLYKIQNLKNNEALVKGDVIIAVNTSNTGLKEINPDICKNYRPVQCECNFLKINHLWELFKHNGEAVVNDYKIITKGKKSLDISKDNNLLNPENIFIEKSARVKFVTVNASAGPVYIGKDVEIMEGSVIRGPVTIGEQSVLKIGAKIYGPTTIGPFSRIGGEVNNCIITGYSNKGHDGFLGQSVLGEWCNIGADTNASNLKNNYDYVKLWNYDTEKFEKTDQQFCGLIMGDHSKCGINTMFNTGTVVGFNANIFGSGYPRNFIPSFSWGGPGGFTTYLLPKALEVAETVMARRDIELTEQDKQIFEKIFEITSKYRKF
ncbi:MAG: GlmU family protein [Bacteroidales bacterium]|nr:MAG: GlmU family protein [Bacteroidales bacterium]